MEETKKIVDMLTKGMTSEKYVKHVEQAARIARRLSAHHKTAYGDQYGDLIMAASECYCSIYSQAFTIRVRRRDNIKLLEENKLVRVIKQEKWVWEELPVEYGAKIFNACVSEVIATATSIVAINGIFLKQEDKVNIADLSLLISSLYWEHAYPDYKMIDTAALAAVLFTLRIRNEDYINIKMSAKGNTLQIITEHFFISLPCYILANADEKSTASATTIRTGNEIHKVCRVPSSSAFFDHFKSLLEGGEENDGKETPNIQLCH